MMLHEIAHSRFPAAGRYAALARRPARYEAMRLKNVHAIHLARSYRHQPGPRSRGRARRGAPRAPAQAPRGWPFARAYAQLEGRIVGRLGAYLGGADCIVHSIHGFGPAITAAAPCMPSRSGRSVWPAESRTASPRLAPRVSARASGMASSTTGHAACALRHRAREFRVPRSRVRRCGRVGIATDAPVVVTVACLKPRKIRCAGLRWRGSAAAFSAGRVPAGRRR